MEMGMLICSLGRQITQMVMGRSYVVFGGPGVGSSGLLALSVSMV